MKFHTLRVWPNGEFGVSPVRRFRPDSPISSEAATIVHPYSWTKSELLTVLDAIACYGSLSSALEALIPGFYPATLEEVATLGSSNATNSHTRVKRGTHGLSSYARKMLRNGCYLLETWAQKRRVAMITTTLPSFPFDIHCQVLENWSEIVRVFTQWAHRRLKAVGGCPWVIGCVEIQEKRLARSGIVAPHLHVVCQSRVKREYTLTKQDVLNAWERAVCSVVPAAEGYSFESSTRIEGVKKSVARYLTKYITKGMSVEVFQSALPGQKMPSSWWVGVGAFKRCIARLMIYRTDATATAVWHAAISKHQKLVQIYSITIPQKYGESLIGIAGKMSRSLIQTLRSGSEDDFLELLR